MKTRLKTIQFLYLILLFILVSCNSGNDATGNQATAPTVASIEIPSQIQVASTGVNQSCFSISSPVTTISANWVNGSFYVNNNCDSNQGVNGLTITISSNNYSLDFKKFSLNSINGLYFGPPTYWASPSMNYTSVVNRNVTAIAATIKTAGNVPAYIEPGKPILISFGYKPDGNLPGEFSYSLNDKLNEVLQGNLSLAINSEKLKTICSGSVTCNIPIILTGQNGNFSQIITTITNSNVGKKLNFNISGLNTGNYTISTGTLPQYSSIVQIPNSIT